MYGFLSWSVTGATIILAIGKSVSPTWPMISEWLWLNAGLVKGNTLEPPLQKKKSVTHTPDTIVLGIDPDVGMSF